MNLSAPFIARPVATILLTAGIALAGALAYFHLPVAPLPQVDYPTISVRASMSGASPEIMATSVATPLEKHLGQIADVTQMTSSSGVGSARITLQFGLDRDIDGAARDVQAAINAARVDLPAGLKSNPTYRKVNPADAPIMILALTSATLTQGQIYDAASTVIEQKLSQVKGIGEVDVGGASLPAVRVELNPQTLFKYGIGLEDVRAALTSANAHAPKGTIDGPLYRWQIYDNDQGQNASDYRNLVVAYRNNAAVRLSDVADVSDSVEDLRNEGLANGKPSVLVILFGEPGGNIVSTVDQVNAALPFLRESIPSAINVSVAQDRSTTIRASLNDVETTLLIAVVLVVLVVFAFLRSARATFVPAIAVTVSLVGTLGVMYLLGFSLDNLSLMALTIATGFVVDDAIVVLENVTRHLEQGMAPMKAALLGASEVGFTVLSMSLSLCAVFIPILLMSGIVGRLFQEFAVTLSVAILVSLVISLTTTPMICAYLLKPNAEHKEGRIGRTFERLFARVQGGYEHSLDSALRHPRLTMLVLLLTVCLNVFLYVIVPKGFFPQEDTGRLIGNIRADQSISFQLMKQKFETFLKIVQADPAVSDVTGSTGGGGGGGGAANSGSAFITLKPRGERNVTADQVIARLRGKLAQVPGATLFLQSVQDIRAGGRSGNAQYQYTLQGDSLEQLYDWGPKLAAALQKVKAVSDVDSDQQTGGLETVLNIDRQTAARLGVTAAQIDNTLYDAFGQRQVSTIYNPLNQYHVIMEVAPQWWQSPDILRDIWISSAGGGVGGTASTNTGAVGSAASNAATNAIGSSGKNAASTGSAVATSAETMIPLSSIATYGPGTTPLSVSHQGLQVATTISFNLAPGNSLSDAVTAINQAADQIGMPSTIHGSFQGTAQVYQQSLASEPILILAALIAIYVVLGVLYESLVHPLTILSTLPSAGVGAVLALLLFKVEFSLIALIGVFLLIGIVKKNAIMMIDFALTAEREQGLSSKESIRTACLMRFRPIMMTTLAAILGALPLALGLGEGGELRQPLGLAIVGGLIVSQTLTLYTTPVIYLYLDRFSAWVMRNRRPMTEVRA